MSCLLISHPHLSSMMMENFTHKSKQLHKRSRPHGVQQICKYKSETRHSVLLVNVRVTLTYFHRALRERQSLFFLNKAPLASEWRRWKARTNTLTQLAGICQSNPGHQVCVLKPLLFSPAWAWTITALWADTDRKAYSAVLSSGSHCLLLICLRYPPISDFKKPHIWK